MVEISVWGLTDSSGWECIKDKIKAWWIVWYMDREILVISRVNRYIKSVLGIICLLIMCGVIRVVDNIIHKIVTWRKSPKWRDKQSNRKKPKLRQRLTSKLSK